MASRLLCCFAAVSLACPSFAATPQDFFGKIRQNNLARLKELIREGPVNQADARGTTPLHYAAAFGSVEAMQLLIAAGADLSARNGLGATALIYAAPSAKRVKLLLDAGADATLATKAGRSALIVAAGRGGGYEAAKLLLDAGSAVNSADEDGRTALLEAASYGDLDTVRLLLYRGADAKAVDKTGDNALMGPASIREPERVRLLISRGADVNAASVFGGEVRHGPIALTGMTPLITAAPHSPAEVVRVLLEGGAKVNVQDGRGQTPLMAAVSSENQDPQVIKTLLAAGADVNAKDGNGDSVLDWARKVGSPAIIRMLEAAGAKGREPGEAPKPAARPAAPQTAVLRAMALLQKSSTGFFNETGCVGCHHQPATARAELAVLAAGMKVPDAGKQEQIRGMTASKVFEPTLVLFKRVGGRVDTVGTMLMGFAAAGVPASPLTDAAVHYIAGNQDRSGGWISAGLSRAPIEESNITRTAIAIKALKEYGWPARQPEFDERISRARAWLLSADPKTNYERADLLLGLYWAGAGPDDLERVAGKLKREQRQDGGWAQNAYLKPDAYATGLALSALHEAGQLKENDPVYRCGVDYLLKTQLEDGSWYVRSRAPKFQPYFQSGFPHDHDQWISAMATAYAVMALAPAVQVQSTASSLMPRSR
jgi:ankyrin repeat protein